VASAFISLSFPLCLAPNSYDLKTSLRGKKLSTWYRRPPEIYDMEAERCDWDGWRTKTYEMEGEMQLGSMDGRMIGGAFSLPPQP
jgi:hypothetical protein